MYKQAIITIMLALVVEIVYILNYKENTDFYS